MAHFARLGPDNKVLAVHRVHNNVATTEQAGADFLNTTHKLNAVWKQTSYNTRNGVHKLGGTPFRKNYAAKGSTYDEAKDAFILKQPYPSWILNEDTCQWEAPVAFPDDGKKYIWIEETTSWVESWFA
jgi:hypothetical protein